MSRLLRFSRYHGLQEMSIGTGLRMPEIHLQPVLEVLIHALPPWLSAFQKYMGQTRSKPTARRYVIAVTSFLTWAEGALGRISVVNFPPETLSGYTQHLLSKSYKSTSIQLHLSGINRYFRWLKEHRNVKIPEFYSVEMPKNKRKVKDILDSRALALYFKYANELEEPARTAVMLLPCSGLRSQEMVSLALKSSLRRSPFRLGDGTVKDTICLVFPGKGGHERIVPLLDEGVTVLHRYLKGWRASNIDTLYLFPGRGSHISTRKIRDAVQSVREKIGMEFTPHTMRRTYLTTLYRKGVDITMLAKIAGHSNTQILVDFYLALDETDIVGAVHSKGGRLTA